MHLSGKFYICFAEFVSAAQHKGVTVRLSRREKRSKRFSWKRLRRWNCRQSLGIRLLEDEGLSLGYLRVLTLLGQNHDPVHREMLASILLPGAVGLGSGVVFVWTRSVTFEVHFSFNHHHHHHHHERAHIFQKTNWSTVYLVVLACWHTFPLFPPLCAAHSFIHFIHSFIHSPQLESEGLGCYKLWPKLIGFN